MTRPHLDEVTLAETIVAALADTQPSWVTLPAASGEVPGELQAAVDAFDAGEWPAAAAAASWLKTRALDAHQTSRTRLLIAEHRVAGFYSLASAQVALSQRHRKRLDLDPAVVRVPAALVTWIAKDPRSGIDGKALLLHAAATARRAAALQATALLVVDPFDDETAVMWRERFGFRASSEPGELKRMWLPLAAAD